MTAADHGPLPIGEHLSRLREVLESTEGPPPVPLLGDDLDPGVLADLRQHGIAEQRAMRWSAICPQRFYLANLAWTRAEHGDEAADQIAEWMTLSPRPNLNLLGPVGTGKTGTALAACRPDWIDRGLSVQFRPCVDLLDDLRPGGPEGTKDELVDIDRLIIDDIGAERVTDWTAERLYAVINRRWMEERATITTANFVELADYREAVGPRVYSRLVGDDAFVVNLFGRDRRLAGG